jgi:hypothetical protein
VDFRLKWSLTIRFDLLRTRSKSGIFTLLSGPLFSLESLESFWLAAGILTQDLEAE